MLKRLFLSFAFVGALTAGGLGLTNKAAAWHDCDDDYGYRYAYPTYASYGPRVVYYPTVRTYPVYYGRVYEGHHHRYYDYDHDHHHHHSGIHVSFGF